MSLFDQIKAAASSALGSVSVSALPGLINQVYPGGLDGMLRQMQQSGYGQQVNSWLGRGANEPITGADLRNVLGNQHVREMAERLGIPADQVLDALAKALPESVDRHSPDGQLQTPPPAPQT